MLPGPELPDGAHEYLTNAMVRTEFQGNDPTTPTSFEILTKIRVRAFLQPKLAHIHGSRVIIKAFVPRSSGVLCGLQEVYIVLLPKDTFFDARPQPGEPLKEE